MSDRVRLSIEVQTTLLGNPHQWCVCCYRAGERVVLAEGAAPTLEEAQEAAHEAAERLSTTDGQEVRSCAQK